MGKQKNRKNDKEFGNTDFDSLSKQLKQHGLTVKEMLGDGNCLFRSLGDQYEGHSKNHIQLRLKVVDYIKSHRDQFEPFIEDDVPFDDHVKNLSEPGTYGGNDAIVAFSRLYNVKIVIHQYNSPAWVIHPSGDSKQSFTRPELNISYHNGDHYNSVVKSNGSVEVAKSQSLPSTTSPKNSNVDSKNSKSNKTHTLPKNSKGKSQLSQSSSVSSLSEPRIEDLTISDDTSSNSNSYSKDSDKTEKKENQTSQTNANKGKTLSRRQKLDQRKKDRKAEALQRKRGSVSEPAVLPSSNSNAMTSITNSVKTLNI